jgi:hypothetical protein
MRLIDDNGMIFGKINIIDFLVVIFLLAFVPVIFLWNNIISNRLKSRAPSELIETELNCKFIKVTPDILKQIAIGDRELNSKGETIGEIVWLGEIKPNQYAFNLGSGQTAFKEDSVLKEVYVKLKLKAEVGDNNVLYYKKEQMVINFPFWFTAKNYYLQVVPYLIKSPQERWVKLKIKFSGIIIEVANIMKEGDNLKNIDERIFGKLEKIYSNKASEVLMSKDTQWVTISHPYLKDLITSWDILCTDRNGVLYFQDYPIKIGNTVNFMTDLYSVYGTVIGLEI